MENIQRITFNPNPSQIMEKTTFFNLIILDESGSMSPMRSATIEGCNSVISGGRQVQQENPDTQRVLMSIYAFQSGYHQNPSRYIVKHKPVADVADLTADDYRPSGCTPLYDAIGTTLTELESVASTHADATGMITIMTDGEENSSTTYSHADCVRLIDRFKEMGWTINFFGANIDVEKVSGSLHIDHSMAFSADCAGVGAAMKAQTKYCIDIMRDEASMCDAPINAKMQRRRTRGKDIFGK